MFTVKQMKCVVACTIVSTNGSQVQANISTWEGKDLVRMMICSFYDLCRTSFLCKMVGDVDELHCFVTHSRGVSKQKTRNC